MREKSLVNAIARAKRNIYKYSAMENILDAAYEYDLRSDEIEALVNSVNKYAADHCCDTVEYDRVMANY